MYIPIYKAKYVAIYPAVYVPVYITINIAISINICNYMEGGILRTAHQMQKRRIQAWDAFELIGSAMAPRVGGGQQCKLRKCSCS